jgi:methylglutaconyl-CoA hydratase
MLSLTRHGDVQHVRLDRPQVRNAFDPALIEAVTRWARDAATDATLRVVTIGGNGQAFCAGADVTWMREMRAYDQARNLEDAERLAAMFEAITALPMPVVGRVHGAALGGGAGLLAVCDHVVAAENVTIGFTEARIGLLPAVIAPFVARRIGWSASRSLFLTARWIGAADAQRVGLVHDVVAPEDLDAGVNRAVADLLAGAPSALREAKALLAALETGAPDARTRTTQAIARQRVSAEGQEGLAAFLEKRTPGWVPEVLD